MEIRTDDRRTPFACVLCYPTAEKPVAGLEVKRLTMRTEETRSPREYGRLDVKLRPSSDRLTEYHAAFVTFSDTVYFFQTSDLKTALLLQLPGLALFTNFVSQAAAWWRLKEPKFTELYTSTIASTLSVAQNLGSRYPYT